MNKVARQLTSAALASIGGLHIAWGFRSSIPFGSQAELADAVVGSQEVPPPMACHAVALALLVASGLVADAPIAPRRVRRSGRHVVAAVLAVRGIVGVAGMTDRLSPGSTSPRFRRLDRRVYAPLCIALAIGALTAKADGERRLIRR